MARCFKFIAALATALLLVCGAASAQSAADKFLFEAMLKLADKGEPEAQYHVGMFFNNGIGTETNPKQAFQWFKKSAEAGDPLGAYKLGCYYHGQFAGVIEPDETLGLKYKLVAAEQGYDLAQFDVANRYYASSDFTQAVRWWKEAARQGDAQSMYHLSNAYAQGQGAAADLKLSYRYLAAIKRMPEHSSDQFIADALASVAAKMSPDEVSAAKGAAAFVAEPTALTLKARLGISQAELYLAENMN